MEMGAAMLGAFASGLSLQTDSREGSLIKRVTDPTGECKEVKHVICGRWDPRGLSLVSDSACDIHGQHLEEQSVRYALLKMIYFSLFFSAGDAFGFIRQGPSMLTAAECKVVRMKVSTTKGA